MHFSGNLSQLSRTTFSYLFRRKRCSCRFISSSSYNCSSEPYKIFKESIELHGQKYATDDFTKITPKILSLLGRNLHLKKHHPICLIKKRIVSHFYHKFVNRAGNPIFAVFDNLSPVVTSRQNFDTVLIPEDHVSRKPRDTYYINRDVLLRTHTSAHQHEFINTGLDRFLVVGDVYRRDEIDSTHYPVFHQMEGVRLYSPHELFGIDADKKGLQLFEKGKRSADKQESHTLEATKVVELNLKKALTALMEDLFGNGIETRWVDVYFPFTHPSWELEIKYQGEWLEVLGSGIMEQKLLHSAGAGDKIGYAFGLGLERLAMILFSIPDIRLFWSTDERFINQFKTENPFNVKYKALSKQPPNSNYLSFWCPPGYDSNDFLDLVRSVGGDLVEKVELADQFRHPTSQRLSHCYHIVYRHMERPLPQAEANRVHSQIADLSEEQLKVEVRRLPPRPPHSGTP